MLINFDKKRHIRFTKNEFADFLREAHDQFDKPIMLILDRACPPRRMSSIR